MKPKQECHGARRRLHSRALLGSLVLASASLSACGDDHGEDSADLQAILHDGDLTQIMRSMLMAPPHRHRRGHQRRASAAATTGAGREQAPGTGRGTGAAGTRHPRHGHRGLDRLGRDGHPGHGHRGHDRRGRDRHGRRGPDPQLPRRGPGLLALRRLQHGPHGALRQHLLRQPHGVPLGDGLLPSGRLEYGHRLRRGRRPRHRA